MLFLIPSLVTSHGTIYIRKATQICGSLFYAKNNELVPYHPPKVTGLSFILNIYYSELMNLNIFEGFHSIAISIITEVQMGPFVASWKLFQLAPEFLLYNPSSFT